MHPMMHSTKRSIATRAAGVESQPQMQLVAGNVISCALLSS
jgi:hypothetical protein